MVCAFLVQARDNETIKIGDFFDHSKNDLRSPFRSSLVDREQCRVLMSINFVATVSVVSLRVA